MTTLTEQRIFEIAEAQSNNICAPGLPGAERNNALTIEHAIKLALYEEGLITMPVDEPTELPTETDEPNEHKEEHQA